MEHRELFERETLRFNVVVGALNKNFDHIFVLTSQ